MTHSVLISLERAARAINKHLRRNYRRLIIVRGTIALGFGKRGVTQRPTQRAEQPKNRPARADPQRKHAPGTRSESVCERERIKRDKIYIKSGIYISVPFPLIVEVLGNSARTYFLHLEHINRLQSRQPLLSHPVRCTRPDGGTTDGTERQRKRPKIAFSNLWPTQNLIYGAHFSTPAKTIYVHKATEH